MFMPVCTFVSFRLGLTDGVSIVARHWQDAMESFGFETLTVAGEGDVDRIVPGLELGATTPPDAGQVADALRDADLIVVENLCTIPLNLPAARAVANACAGRPTIMHHHDPPWQRSHFEHITELPMHDEAWRHVVINDLTVQQFRQRGLPATRIYNGFADPGTPGPEPSVRQALGLAADELVFAHPVRAIERKNVPAALRLAEELGATYWLWGPAEDGYQPNLDRLLADAGCRVVQGSVDRPLVDLYRAANAVVFPSTWEGFGNPPVEAALHHLPAAVGDYPVAAELRALSFRWFPTHSSAALGEFLANPDHELLTHNRSVARQHLSLDVMTGELRKLLERAGWLR